MPRATLAVVLLCWLLDSEQNARLGHAPPGPSFMPYAGPQRLASVDRAPLWFQETRGQ